MDFSCLADEEGALLLALVSAGSAGCQGEVPVGAVLRDAAGRFLGECGNQCVDTSDPTGHAEMRALRLGAMRVGNYRLSGSTLTVTLEPCPMCLAASAMARVARVTFEVKSPLAGRELDESAVFHVNQYVVPGCFPPNRPELPDAGELLRIFFAQRRKICSNEPLR